MLLHGVQLKVMAVGTVGCGVVDLCGSNAFPVLESTILIGRVVLFVVSCKNKFIEHHVSGGIAQTIKVVLCYV